jgi:hypothetical protein
VGVRTYPTFHVIISMIDSDFNTVIFGYGNACNTILFCYIIISFDCEVSYYDLLLLCVTFTHRNSA